MAARRVILRRRFVPSISRTPDETSQGKERFIGIEHLPYFNELTKLQGNYGRGLLNEPSDLNWLFETHLSFLSHDVRKKYKSFVLYVNEDCPSRIDLYENCDPNCDDLPTILTLW